MIVSFLCPGVAAPSGGVLAIHQFAAGLERRGHTVHIFHLPLIDDKLCGLEDLAWAQPSMAVNHHFDVDPYDDPGIGSDFVVCFDDERPAGLGHPLVLVQAYRILEPAHEDRLFVSPGLKVCTSTWLAEMVRAAPDVAPRQVAHLPYGIDHSKFRVLSPPRDRKQRVSMLFNVHPTKAAWVGIGALEQARLDQPGLQADIFGVQPRPDIVPDWMTYHHDPDQKLLVESIYNGGRIFISPAFHEGFGLAACEAMACGAALVSTDNGGSRDYAIHGETAMVSPPHDVDAMASNLVALLRDDPRRLRIAEKGMDFVQRFDWDRSAEVFEGLLDDYGADPARILSA